MTDADETPTPAASGNDGTTPPEADKTGTTQPAAETAGKPDQAEIDKLFKARLDREKKKWEAEKTEAEKRARMDEAERLKAEKTDLEQKVADAEAKALAAERKATLAGKVKDADYALFKVNQAPEKYLKGDALNVDAFLKDYPDQALGKAGPAPTTPGGGTADKQDMNALIRDAIRQRS